MKKQSLELVLGVGLGLFVLSVAMNASAQPLTKDTPTGNLTGEIDISIDPAMPLPANGTVTISTEGASDTDMDGLPPDGVYVIISSNSVTVTNQPVEIPTAEDDSSGSDDSSSDDSSGSDEDPEEE